MENPLNALGVPKEVVSRAAKSGSQEMARAIAEANFKTLAKFFHPDRPGGDAEYMMRLSDAVDEVRDDDALQFYIEEILDSQSYKDANLLAKIVEAQQKKSQASSAALAALQGFWKYLDSGAALGLTTETRVLCVGDEIVNDIQLNPNLGSKESAVKIVTYPNEGVPDESSADTKWIRGEWKFRDTFKTAKPVWHKLGSRSQVVQSARILGFVVIPTTKPRNLNTASAALSSERRALPARVWTDFESAWFLPFISFGLPPFPSANAPILQHVELVLVQDGRLTLSGKVVNVRVSKKRTN